MEVTKTYEIAPQEVFDLLCDSFCEDYRANTGEFLEATAITEGLTYLKSFGKNNAQQVKVVVQAMTAPTLYDVAIHSNRGVTRITYHLQAIDDTHTEITYSEAAEQAGFLTGWNYKLLAPFMRKAIEKRMATQLDSIVNYAKQRRANHPKN
ncbi:DUF3284 domain-containing protein [Aerococcaceae bacterium NML190073]|nr:DUF3284 domain-containing protein [Aerococcaceae bacterium NML190073]